MSRFYDVLRQASRSLHAPPEQSNDLQAEIADLLATVQEPGASQVIPSQASPVEKDPHAGGPLHGAEDWVEGDASHPTEEAPAAPIPRNGSYGTSANARLDHKARLLPHAANSMIAEHYRLLRTQILQQQAERMFRTVLITSPGPGEGKTVTLPLAPCEHTCGMRHGAKEASIDILEAARSARSSPPRRGISF